MPQCIPRRRSVAIGGRNAGTLGHVHHVDNGTIPQRAAAHDVQRLVVTCGVAPAQNRTCRVVNAFCIT